MNDRIKQLFDDGYYIVAVFDDRSDIVYSNKKFQQYFPVIRNKEEFKAVILSEELFDDKRKCIIVDSPQTKNIIKFEVNFNAGHALYMGVIMDSSELFRWGCYVDTNLDKDAKESLPQSMSMKIRSSVYSTLTFDQEWKLRYLSENTKDILGEGEYLEKSMEEIFGREISEKILSRTHYFRVFDDVTIDMEGKMVVVSELSSGYKVLNVYPYSSNTMNKFEEIAHLKYKIRKLEQELSDRDKFIKTQKEIFKSLTTVDGLTKLYNRRYLIERFSEEMNKIAKNGYTFAITNFRIRNFKQVNMQIGYEKADELLKYLSVIIKKRLHPDNDMAFRIGNAEFLILSRKSSEEIAKRQFESLQEEFLEHTGFELSLHIFDSQNMDESIIGLYHEHKQRLNQD